MGDTSISWTDKTWNPIRGCSRVSEGCRNCYAERVAVRFSGPGQPYEGLAQVVAPRDHMDRVGGRRNGWTREVRFVAEHLADPLRWRKPQRVFVNSMSDLFHEKLTNEQIAAVFGVMAACPQHTFQVLTKRAKRMREWFEWVATLDDVGFHLDDIATDAVAGHFDCCHLGLTSPGFRWPLPNVWLGVSVENQAAADERIPELLRTPAAVRFLSCEPLLGHLAIAKWMRKNTQAPDTWMPPLDWVIAGCESGPGARPCDVAWLRSLRDQCAAAGVPYFLKQAEESTDCGEDRNLDIGDDDSVAFDEGSKMKARRPGGHHIIELPYLDGVQHAAFPEVDRG